MSEYRNTKLRVALLLGAVGAAVVIAGLVLYTPEQIAPPKGVTVVSQAIERPSAIAAMLADPRKTALPKSLAVDELKTIYEARAYRPIWSGTPRTSIQAAQVLRRLKDAGAEGLDPADYHVESLTRPRPRNDEGRAEFDLLLTDGVLRYARDLDTGRDKAKAIDSDVLTPEALDLTSMLSVAAQNGSVSGLLDSLKPAHAEYAILMKSYARYRAIADRGGWPRVPTGTKLSDDPADANMMVLRQRLSVEDSALSTEAPAAGPASDDLTAALTRYQARNGLKADGKLGRETLEMLNITASERAGQIAANMERWRWLPARLEPTRIMVNVTDQMLAAIRDDRIALTSRVVVGAPHHKTPILVAKAVAVTVNPPWNVPASIIENEILPKLATDPSYLDAQRMTMKGDGASLRIQQAPGDHNALGRVKFELPNRFNVYLHDTPAKKAFAADVRTLSHGCVRVQNIHELALFALGTTPQELEEKIAANKTQGLKLASELPVYIMYWTAIPQADGTVAFRKDVYDRDARFIAAFGGVTVSALSGSPRT